MSKKESENKIQILVQNLKKSLLRTNSFVLSIYLEVPTSLDMVTDTTARDQHWGGDETLKYVLICAARLCLA